METIGKTKVIGIHMEHFNNLLHCIKTAIFIATHLTNHYGYHYVNVDFYRVHISFIVCTVNTA